MSNMKNSFPVMAPRLCEAAGLFATTLWFGVVTGWLDLLLVVVQRTIHPHVTDATVRTNDHFEWMVPASAAIIFGAAGVVIAGLAMGRVSWTRWMAPRVWVGMSALALLLSIQELHPIAAALLACGLGEQIGAWLGRQAVRFDRLVRVSGLWLASAMVGFGAMAYLWAGSAERRAMAMVPPARPGSPNVLLIVLDTVRAGSLGLYGHHRPTVPNLERLADHGLVFAEARSPAPWTTPTHASLLTGRWPHELSVRSGIPLDATYPTLAETLGGIGYATAGFVGNVDYCSAAYGLGRGFARYEDACENRTISLVEILENSALGRRVNRALGYPKLHEHGELLRRKTARMINRDVLRWLDHRPAEKPFFVFINYFDAHRPYLLHEAPSPRFGMAARPVAEQLEMDNRLSDLLQGRPLPAGYTPRRIVEDALMLYRDSYDSCIAYIDYQIGQLLNEMGQRGLLENTMVIVTSDHGEQLGEHGLIAHGTSLYREEVHVPLVVIPPRPLSSPRVVREPVSIREVAATIADGVGLNPRGLFPGLPLTRFLDEGSGKTAAESPVLSELADNVAFHESGPMAFRRLRSLVSEGLVYIRGDDDREELYDLMNDPTESIDLARDPRARTVVARLREELSQLCRDERERE